MSELLSVPEFFERTLPDRFASAMAGVSDDITGQADLAVTYEITGEGGGIYGVRISGGALEVVPGGLSDNDMRTIVSYDDWARTHVTAWEEPALDYVQRGKVRIIKGLKGTLKLELPRDDDAEYSAVTIFGASEEPEVIIRMTVDDYAAMVRGELNGQMAFMTGKLKFEGSLPLLMQLGALNV